MQRLILALMLLAVAPAFAADRLVAPFDVEAARAVRGAAAKAYECKAPPPPQRDLIYDSFYQPGTNSSVVNEANLKSYEAARKPVEQFEQGVIQIGDAYIKSKPVRPEIAACVLNWMNIWAAAGGLQGKTSQQGGYERKWVLGSTSVAYLKIRDAAGLDPTEKQAVETWLRGWADKIKTEYSNNLTRSDHRNNHAYWAGWSVMAAGIALNDRGYFDWGAGQYRVGAKQITDEGILPLEMDRRQRALHYHLYALQPLVMLAEAGARNGVDLYGESNGAIHRLVKLTVSAFADPAFFKSKTGDAQEWKNSPVGGDLGWALPYAARFPSPDLAGWIAKFDRFSSTRVLGDAQLLYGKP